MRQQTKAYLKEAVHHSKASSRTGMLERMFTWWFGGFVYNQIWEDPRVDAEALQLGPGNRMLTISSGGCNVLNYLSYQPEHIDAIDLNTNHMSMARLRLAAMKHLPDYHSFFNFFGLANQPDNIRNYYKYVRPHLDENTREFWEGGGLLRKALRRKRINYFQRNLYRYAKLGWFLRFVHMMGRLTGTDPEKLFECETLDEQEKYFKEHLEPFFDNRLIRWMGKQPITVFSLGIPPSQHKVMLEESGGNIVDLYRERARKITCGFPLSDNYYTWQAFGCRYDDRRRALPEYLKQENYDLIKGQLDKVQTHICTFHQFLEQQPDNSLDRFVLLDSQDWMPPEVIAELWTDIARVGKPGTRIIFRTSGITSPIETSLPPELMAQYTCEKELAQRLHDQDRSSIYGGFHVYSLNK